MISLARFVAIHTRSWAANSSNERVRLRAEKDGLRSELARRDEEIRIKDARMARLDPHRRPHDPPTERMAILQLRAATIASWCRRLDEQGPKALVRVREPVNRFPDYVTHIVRFLKLTCPWLGKRKIAGLLTRAGLHLGTTTGQRMLTKRPRTAALRPQRRVVTTLPVNQTTCGTLT